MGFPERLEQAITESGKSQNELARETGIAQSSISAMTRGARKPYLYQATALAKALGKSIDFLAGYEAGATSRPGPVLTADEERSLWLIRELGLTAGELARRLTGEPGGKGLAAMVGHADESEMAKRRAIEEKRRLGFELEGDVQATGGDLKDGPSGPRGR